MFIFLLAYLHADADARYCISPICRRCAPLMMPLMPALAISRHLMPIIIAPPLFYAADATRARAMPVAAALDMPPPMLAARYAPPC